MVETDSEKLSRREALKKLSQLSAYSAPAVTALLVPTQSYAQSSIPEGNTSCLAAGRHTIVGVNTPTSSDGFVNLFTEIFGGRPSDRYSSDTTQDCGE